MRTEMIKASELDDCAIGLRVIIPTGSGEAISGGISDVHHPQCCQEHKAVVWCWVGGQIVRLMPDKMVELEMTASQIAAITDAEQRQAIDLANAGRASAVEKALEGGMPSSIVVDEVQLAVPVNRSEPIGHLVLTVLVSVVIVIAAVVYGLASPALSGHTFAAIFLVLVAGGALLGAMTDLRLARGWRV